VYAVQRLTNTVRDYDWGSRLHIARLQGLPTAEQPMAEMWLGAHPGAPSTLADGRTLDEAIAADPTALLGARVADRFDGRLPFLMKLLAAAEPLSLQVHPSSEQARAGYAEEDRAGVPLMSAARNYKDASHKPELIYALTRFEGMAGFRELGHTAEILRLLGLPWLDNVATLFEETGTPFQSLRSVVKEWLSLGGAALSDRVEEVRRAAAVAEDRAHRAATRRSEPVVDRQSVERESRRVFAQTAELAAKYPHDAGVLVTLLLNHVVLAPGEALFLDAGVIHAYTSGFGVEIMAASDNVVRAGLTSKHVDVPELMRISDFRPMPAPLWAGQEVDGVQVFDPPVRDFVLQLADVPCAVLAAAGPRIVLALDGAVRVAAGGTDVLLAPGESAFVAGADGPLSVSGEGRVAVASVP